MADTKISALPAATALTGTELVPIVQGGVTVRSTPAAFVSNGSLALSGTNLTYTGTLTGSTGIVNIGSGQVYKDASGNLGLGVTPSGTSKLEIAGSSLNIRTQRTNDGTQSNYWAGYNADGTAAYWVGQVSATNDIYFANRKTASIIFQTDSLERMRLDVSGNLGLGVTPSAWSTTDSVRGMQLNGGALYVYGTNRVYLGQNVILGSGSIENYIATAAASTYRQSAGSHLWYNAPSGTAGAAITFTQAMTLDASGNLLVGTTSVFNSARISVNAAGSSGSVALSIGNANDTYFAANFRNAAGISVGNISCTVSATAYNTSSDQRLKQNIQDAASASALIDAIQVRQYDWKSDGSHQRYGFVAQELLTVAPEAVHQPADTEAMMAVDYSKLVPMLVKEVQSLRQRLQTAGI